MLSKLQISRSSLYLCGFLFVTQFVNGYMNIQNRLSATSNLWYLLVFYWAIIWWFVVDSSKQGERWTGGHLDMGMFLYIGGVFLIPFYLFKTRGWKALYTIGLFIGAIYGAYITGAIISLMVSLF